MGIESALDRQTQILTGDDEDAWQHANEIEQMDAHQRMMARFDDGRAPIAIALGSIVAAGFLMRAISDPAKRAETIRLATRVLRDAIRKGPSEPTPTPIPDTGSREDG